MPSLAQVFISYLLMHVVHHLVKDLLWEHLKNSTDDLIKFLSTTDLRASNIKPEDVNIKFNDRLHSSPLHLSAAKEGSTELVKVLLSKGANLEAKDKDGW